MKSKMVHIFTALTYLTGRKTKNLLTHRSDGFLFSMSKAQTLS